MKPGSTHGVTEAGALLRRSAWTQILAFAALLLGVAIFVWASLGSSDRTSGITNEVALVNETQRLIATMLSVESSERGYVLTGAPEFREPYDTGIQNVGGQLETVAGAYMATEADPDAMNNLRGAVAAQLSFAAEVVRVRTEDGFDAAAALVRSGVGRERMDEVRGIVAWMQDVSTARMVRLAAERRSYGAFSSFGFALAALAAIALAGLAWRRQRDARRSRGILDAVLANAPVGIGFVGRDLQPQPLGSEEQRSSVLEQFPLARDDVAARLRTVLSSERPEANVEFEGVDPDRRLLASLFPLRLDTQGSRSADGVGFVVTDTTEKAVAEERLRDAERRFRSLVETSAAIVWSASAEGRFGGEQEGWSRFTGQTKADYSDLGWTEAIHPDDRERSAEAWRTATASRSPYGIEHRVRRADGKWRDMLASAVPILGPDGQVREWIGTHTDITDHKLTAARLRESHSQFQSLADNIPQMAWMAKPDGRIYWYNKRWFDFTGTTLEEMRDFGWVAVHHPEHAERVRDSYERALKAGEDWEDTFPLRGADGSYRWFLSRAVPIRRQDGAIERWFGTNTDVTRQREQERELQGARDAAENANRAKSQFIANMSHELRTPLTAVIGYTEMLEDEVEDLGEPALLADLGKINSNARHLLGLINDVLDLSKIEAERMDVHAETFEIAALVDDIVSSTAPLVEKKSNRLVLDLSDDLGTAHSDEMKLRQCLMNLVSNASKFTENGTITLRARRQHGSETGDWFVFDVIDTGIGMSPEQLEKLFQRFTQADASTTRRFGGTGLGLAITKAFCKLLGGDIAVSSREGEGSTFTIKIPAVASPSTVEPDSLVPITPDERRASGGLVLAIDDDPSTRDLVSRFLTREGFLVRSAPDGLAGLEMARLLRPDAILLDVTMPRMDGWSVLSALKADADLSRIPVVMLTVLDEHSLGYALGASDYLLKPVEWEHLRKVMDRYRTREDAMVLAVDDDEAHLARTRTTLERNGFTVVTAENGRVALERLEHTTPDLILTDLVMPEMDGFAFIRAVRKRPQTAQIPIVVLTSKDLTREEFRRLRPDTEDVLSKDTVELAELADQLRVIIPPATGIAPAASAAPLPATEPDT